MGDVRFFRHVAAAVIGASLVFGGAAAGVGSFVPGVSAQEAQAAEQTYVDVDALNVRSAPSLSGTITTTLSYGTVVTLIGESVAADGYAWYQVQQGGTTLGWSVNGFTTGSVPVGGGTIPTTPPTPATGGFVYGSLVVVSTDLLNVRSLPSISAAVLDVYGYGTVALVTGDAAVADGYAWYPVDNLGWVAGDFVTRYDNGHGGSPTTPTPSPAPGTFIDGDPVMVNTDLLNVRSLPSISASILTVYPYATTGTITGGPTVADGVTWYAVDNYGWVAGQYLWLNACGCRDGVYPPDEDGSTAPGNEFNVTADVLNVRSGPGLNSPIVDTLSFGDAVTVYNRATTADGLSWVPIDEQETRWVAAQFVG